MKFRHYIQVRMMIAIGAALVTVSLTNDSFIRAQAAQVAPPPNVRLPDEVHGN